MVPQSKSRQIYLKMCTLVNLKILSRNLTLIFQDFMFKIYVWVIASEIKTSLDLIENLHSRCFEFAEYKSSLGIF